MYKIVLSAALISSFSYVLVDSVESLKKTKTEITSVLKVNEEFIAEQNKKIEQQKQIIVIEYSADEFSKRVAEERKKGDATIDQEIDAIISYYNLKSDITTISEEDVKYNEEEVKKVLSEVFGDNYSVEITK